MAEHVMRTVVIPLPAHTTRCDLRFLCARIHDVAAVFAVEVDTDKLRVTGNMTTDELRAAVRSRGGALLD